MTTTGGKNFTERIKSPIFLERFLAIEIMQEPQSHLEERDSPSILKDDFSSRTNQSIFTTMAPMLLDQSKKTCRVIPALT